MYENCTDLVLLIGTNPLPNYIVAHYFLNSEDSRLQTIWLVHSEKNDAINQDGTLHHAEQLQRTVLSLAEQKSKTISVRQIPLADISQATKITEDTRKKLISQFNNASQIHLNYTGGTKAMGIHIYRTLEKELSNRLSCSYLNGRHYTLCDDLNATETTDLRKSIAIAFDDLIALHGFHKKREPRAVFYESAQIFKQIIKNDDLNGYYRDFERNSYYSKHLMAYAKTITDFRDQFSQELTLPANLLIDENNIFYKVIACLPEDYRLLDSPTQVKIPPNASCLKTAKEFLHGSWLEDYVYLILQEMNQAQQSQNRFQLFNDQNIGCTFSNYDFQLDLTVVNGYQLTGISCTTIGAVDARGSKAGCKQKGFEVIMRCRQIGGDQAKAVLITGIGNRAELRQLQAELLLETGISYTNILVLGRDHWEPTLLGRELASFIYA